MASAGAIRAGAAFVEIFANDSRLQQTLNRVQARMRAFGSTLRNAGAEMALTGAAIKAPLVLAGRQAAGFEDAVLGMSAAANLSADDVGRLADEAKRLAVEMGTSPTAIAQSMLALAKAGVGVEAILGGAGRAAVEFARVGGVEATRAADFMYSAMNVFGASAEEAVDTLVSAANASPASIQSLTEAFSQVGSAGKTFGQNIFDVAQGLAVLARAGIDGEEGGTAFKTMLTKLVAPTQDAQEALALLGLKMEDFRDEAGKPLPIQQIAGLFEGVLQRVGGKGPLEKIMSDSALVDVFEQRGIKVVTAYANAGVKGFEAVKQEMLDSLPVSEQYIVMMSGITGSVSRLTTGAQLMAIAFGEAVGESLRTASDWLLKFMAGVSRLIAEFPVASQALGVVAMALIGAGTAAIIAGTAMRAYAAAQAAVLALSGPRGWAVLGVAALLGYGGYLAATYGEASEEIKKARKEIEGAQAAAARKNAVNPSSERQPLDKALIDKQAAAEELAKADQEFEESQQNAIRKIQEMRNGVVDAVEGLGDEALAAGARFQERFSELIDLLERGALNATGAEAISNQLKKQLESELEIIREGMNPAKLMAPDYGRSAGTFGTSGAGLGVGPELAQVMQQAGQPGVAGGVVANAPGAAGMAGRAGDARAGRDMAAGAGAAGARLQGSLDALARAIVAQTKVVEAGNGLLSKIAVNTGKPGAVFA